jgi:hypothetical protein
MLYHIFLLAYILDLDPFIRLSIRTFSLLTEVKRSTFIRIKIDCDSF